MIMKYLRHWLILVLLIAGFSNRGFNQKLQKHLPVGVKISTWSPYVPVLKGLNTNPVLRVAVSIPAGNKEIQIRKLFCTLNTEALKNVQKIDIFLTGAEPFSTSNQVTSVSPSSSAFDIPVSLNLKQGVQFIWFSIVLKQYASMDDPIELRCIKIADDEGKQLHIKPQKNDFVKRTGVVVRKAGDDRVNTYRIPGLVQTDRGTLIAVYDIRYNDSRDLPANIDVGMSRSTDNGKTWEPMKIIMDMGPPHENNGIGDPAVLFDPVTKKIWVAALWSKGNRSIAGSLPGLSPDTTGQFVLVSSSDDGNTWSAPYNITSQVKNPAWHLFFNGPGNGIAMQNGKLVFAAQYWDEIKKPYSTIIYSDDHGATWKGNINGPKSNTTESQVVETIPGTLMLNMRDNRGGFRSVATTADMGAGWTEHTTSYSALVDPVCMASIIKVKVKVKGVMRDVLFFSNVASRTGRINMTVKASLDNGETWLEANQLLVDERLCYGYSCLTKIDDTTIGLLYEGSKDLYFVKIPVSEIIKQGK